MSEPVIAQKSPYEVKVEAGRNYLWCACGLSATQPFCDGSHKGSGLTPMQYVAKRDQTVYFCGCKRSGAKPVCDGAHNDL